MRKYTQECHDLGIAFVYDPSQQLARIDGPTFGEVHGQRTTLTVNEYEYEMVRQKSGLDDAGLLALVDVIVVTLGTAAPRSSARASICSSPPPTPAASPKPTGVGDTWAGLLTSAMASPGM